MTLESMLNEMASVPKCQVMLFKSEFGKEWSSSFEANISIGNTTTKVSLMHHAATPLAAVEETWGRWKSLIDRGMTELSPTLLATPASYTDVTPPQPPLDDEVPF